MSHPAVTVTSHHISVISVFISAISVFISAISVFISVISTCWRRLIPPFQVFHPSSIYVTYCYARSVGTLPLLYVTYCYAVSVGTHLSLLPLVYLHVVVIGLYSSWGVSCQTNVNMPPRVTHFRRNLVCDVLKPPDVTSNMP